MAIVIKLFGDLGESYDRRINITYIEGLTPADIIRLLEIDKTKVAMVLLNGQSGKLATILHQTLNDGDVLSILPLLQGG